MAQRRKAKSAILQKLEILSFLYDQMLPSFVENKTNIHQGAEQLLRFPPFPFLEA